MRISLRLFLTFLPFAFFFLAESTIEARIIDLQNLKQEVVSEIINENNSGSNNFENNNTNDNIGAGANENEKEKKGKMASRPQGFGGALWNSVRTSVSESNGQLQGVLVGSDRDIGEVLLSLVIENNFISFFFMVVRNNFSLYFCFLIFYFSNCFHLIFFQDDSLDLNAFLTSVGNY